MAPIESLDAAQQFHQRALDRFAGGQLEEAACALHAAVRAASERAGLWNDLGVILEALGHAREALRCYRTALDRDPDHVEAQENYALLRRQMGRWRAAQALISTMAGGRGGAGSSAAAKCRAAEAS